MNKQNIKTMAIVAVTSLSLLLSGCSHKTNKPNKSNQPIPNKTIIENEIEYPSTQVSPNISSNTNKPGYETTTVEVPVTEEPVVISPPVVTEEPTQEQVSTTQEFTYFKDAKKKISEYVASEDFENLKNQGKYYVTTGIDFIFYNEPINGVYFNDLTDDVKQAVVKDIEIIDKTIMEYYPDYKENISSKYQVVADFVSTKYYSLLDMIREYLGDENYEAIGNIKSQIIGDISNKKDEAIDYIKNKYNDWKNN